MPCAVLVYFHGIFDLVVAGRSIMRNALNMNVYAIALYIELNR